ncbi:MAG TPA: glycosyltransferase family 2 protein [Terracidiphilus sp.]|nr:glycosyltransferase family 2 protein [Terracidiphilus sp.]
MPAEQGLISVIVPFHNSERFLAETVESVLAQSCAEWELLLVDDGSTDRSAALARVLASRRPEAIHCLTQPGGNRGVNAARNLGAHHARGALLAFLDSDDVWRPNKLAEQSAILLAHPHVGLVYGHSEYWCDWDTEPGLPQSNYTPPLSPPDRVYLPPKLFANSYPLGPWGAPSPSSFLVRHDAFRRVGGFDECFHPGTFQLYEDVAFFAKLALTIPIYVSSASWERYRVSRRSGWILAQNTSKDEAARRFYFQWLRRHLATLNPAEEGLLQLVQRRTWSYRLPLPPALVMLARRALRRLSRQHPQPDAPKY